MAPSPQAPGARSSPSSTPSTAAAAASDVSASEPQSTLLSLPASDLVAIAALLPLRHWRAALRATCSGLWRLSGEATVTLEVPHDACTQAATTCAATFPRATSLCLTHGAATPLHDARTLPSEDGLLLLLHSCGEPPSCSTQLPLSLGDRLTVLDLGSATLFLPTCLAALVACPRLVTLTAPRLLSTSGRRLNAPDFQSFLAALSPAPPPPGTPSPAPDAAAAAAPATLSSTPPTLSSSTPPAASAGAAPAAVDPPARPFPTALGLPHLRHLSLLSSAESLLTADHLLGLDRLTGLESLRLSLCTAASSVGTACFSLIAHLTHLTQLQFDGPSDAASWAQLSPLSRLRHVSGLLDVPPAPPYPQRAPPLGCCEHLVSVEVPGRAIYRGEARALGAQCPALQSLVCWSVDLADKPAVVGAFPPAVQAAAAAASAAVAAAASGSAAVLPQVLRLSVSRMLSRGPDVATLAATFPSLQELTVASLWSLPTAALAEWHDTLSSLRVHDRAGTAVAGRCAWSKLEDAGLLSLSCLSELTIEVPGGLCGALTIPHLAQHLSRLTSLRVAPAGALLASSFSPAEEEDVAAADRRLRKVVAAAEAHQPACAVAGDSPGEAAAVAASEEGSQSSGSGVATAVRRRPPAGPSAVGGGCAAARLMAALPGLRALELEGAEGLDEAGVGALAAATSLRRLVLRHCYGVLSDAACGRVLAQHGRPHLDMRWEGLAGQR